MGGDEKKEALPPPSPPSRASASPGSLSSDSSASSSSAVTSLLSSVIPSPHSYTPSQQSHSSNQSSSASVHCSSLSSSSSSSSGLPEAKVPSSRDAAGSAARPLTTTTTQGPQSGVETPSQTARKHFPETSNNEVATCSAPPSSNIARDLSMPPPAKLPKPLLRKQRKLPGAVPSLPTSSSSKNSSSSTVSSEKIPDESESDHSGDCMSQVNKEASAVSGREKPSPGAGRNVAEAKETGGSSSSGPLLHQKEITKKQQLMSAGSSGGSQVKKVIDGSCKIEDGGQLGNLLGSAPLDAGKVEAGGIQASEMAASLVAVGADVAAVSSPSRLGKVGDASCRSNNNSSALKAETSSVSLTYAASEGRAESGEKKIEAPNSQDQDKSAGGEQEEEKDVNALFESFMSEIEELEQQNRLLLLQKEKPEENTDSAPLVSGVEAHQDVSSAETAIKRSRRQAQTTGGPPVPAPVLPKPFLEAKPTRHTHPSSPTALMSVASTATSGAVQKINISGPPDNKAADSTAATDMTSAAGCASATSAVALNEVVGRAMAGSAGGDPNWERSRMTAATAALSLPVQGASMAGESVKTARDSSSSISVDEKSWNISGTSNNEVQHVREINDVCGRDRDNTSIHTTLRDINISAEIAGKSVTSSIGNYGETGDLQKDLARYVSGCFSSEKDTRYHYVNKSEDDGFSPIPQEERASSDMSVDTDRELLKRRSIAGGRKSATAHLPAKKAMGGSAAEAVVGSGSHEKEEGVERSRRRRRGVEGETGESSNDSRDNTYIPVCTKTLATAEEKITEFLQQLWYIETAVDEHEESQRMRERRRQHQRRGRRNKKRYKRHHRGNVEDDGYAYDSLSGGEEEDMLSEETEFDETEHSLRSLERSSEKEEEEEFFSASSFSSLERETVSGREKRRRGRQQQHWESRRSSRREGAGSGEGTSSSSSSSSEADSHNVKSSSVQSAGAERERKEQHERMRLGRENTKQLLKWREARRMRMMKIRKRSRRRSSIQSSGSYNSSSQSSSITSSRVCSRRGSIDLENVNEEESERTGVSGRKERERRREGREKGSGKNQRLTNTTRKRLLEKRKKYQKHEKKNIDKSLSLSRDEEDSLLEEIIEAELRRATAKQKEIGPDTPGPAAGECCCCCLACNCCENKENNKKETMPRKKKGTKQETKQIEELLWSIAAEMAHLPSKSSVTEWRRRTEAAVEIRRYDWQAGGLEAWYFLSKLRDVRAEIRVKAEEERRLEKLQENSSALASVFPYSAAAALKQEKSSAAVAASPAVPREIVGPTPPKTAPPPLPPAAPPPLPQEMISSNNSNNKEVDVRRMMSSSSNPDMCLMTHVAAGASIYGQGAASSDMTSPPTGELYQECYLSQQQNMDKRDDKAGLALRTPGEDNPALARTGGSGKSVCIGKDDHSCTTNNSSISQTSIIKDSVKEKSVLSVIKPSSRTLHASTSTGAGIRVPTSNPLVKKKMQLVEKWKRNQEREDEEERLLQEERERREQQRQLRERMKIEEWKERQIASGKAASNANLIEVKEDWRSIVEANRSQQRQ